VHSSGPDNIAAGSTLRSQAPCPTHAPVRVDRDSAMAHTGRRPDPPTANATQNPPGRHIHANISMNGPNVNPRRRPAGKAGDKASKDAGEIRPAGPGPPSQVWRKTRPTYLFHAIQARRPARLIRDAGQAGFAFHEIARPARLIYSTGLQRETQRCRTRKSASLRLPAGEFRAPDRPRHSPWLPPPS